MEIILIRHALPLREENETKLADPSLSETGWEQANRLANWLEAEPITHIAVSPRTRAIQTAQPLAQKFNIKPEVIERFSEIDRQATLYIPIEEMRKEKHPHLKKLMNREWEDAGFMDPEMFRNEVVGAYEDLAATLDENSTLAIVAHGGTINAIVSHILGLKDVFFCDFYYTSITRLRDAYIQKSLRLATLNETSHLHTSPQTLDPITKQSLSKK